MCRGYCYPCFYPVVKRNKKIFYFISFEVIKIKNVLKLRILLYFSSNKRSIPLVCTLALTTGISQKINLGPANLSTIKPFHMKKFYLPSIITIYTCMWSFLLGSHIINFFCNLVNKYVVKLA